MLLYYSLLNHISIFWALIIPVVWSATICIKPEYKAPQIRYPPSEVRSTNTTSSSTTTTSSNGNNPTQSTTMSTWPTPNPQALYGIYFITHSSRPVYQSLVNMRAEHYPFYPQTSAFPASSVIDIVSWSTDPRNLTSSAITTVFGWFVPVPSSSSSYSDNTTSSSNYVWRYISTGPLINTTNLYAPLAYGFDREGIGYRIDYETGYTTTTTTTDNETSSSSDDEPCINIASRSENGPDPITLAQILDGLKMVGREYNDTAFIGLVDGIGRIPVDGRRGKDFEPVVCDEACVMNLDLTPV